MTIRKKMFNFEDKMGGVVSMNIDQLVHLDNNSNI